MKKRLRKGYREWRIIDVRSRNSTGPMKSKPQEEERNSCRNFKHEQRKILKDLENDKEY